MYSFRGLSIECRWEDSLQDEKISYHRESAKDQKAYKQGSWDRTVSSKSRHSSKRKDNEVTHWQMLGCTTGGSLGFLISLCYYGNNLDGVTSRRAVATCHLHSIMASSTSMYLYPCLYPSMRGLKGLLDLVFIFASALFLFYFLCMLHSLR